MSEGLVTKLLRLADRIDERLGPVSGADAERAALLMREAMENIVQHDQRVTELLEANNREVERRREAEEWLAKLGDAAQAVIDRVNHNLDTGETGPQKYSAPFGELTELIEALERRWRRPMSERPSKDHP